MKKTNSSCHVTNLVIPPKKLPQSLSKEPRMTHLRDNVMKYRKECLENVAHVFLYYYYSQWSVSLVEWYSTNVQFCSALQVYFNSGQNVLDTSFLGQESMSIVKLFQLTSCSGYVLQVEWGRNLLHSLNKGKEKTRLVSFHQTEHKKGS